MISYGAFEARRLAREPNIQPRAGGPMQLPRIWRVIERRCYGFVAVNSGEGLPAAPKTRKPCRSPGITSWSTPGATWSPRTAKASSLIVPGSIPLQPFKCPRLP